MLLVRQEAQHFSDLPIRLPVSVKNSVEVSGPGRTRHNQVITLPTKERADMASGGGDKQTARKNPLVTGDGEMLNQCYGRNFVAE